jgi:hypothetical protein
MPEFKLSPLMLFVLLLLILIVASYYSSWVKTSEGFATATTEENPFKELANYSKYYSDLVNVSGNFWYDPNNGNIYRVALKSNGNIMGATIIDRYKQKVNVDFSETDDKPDKPEKIVKKNTVDKIIKNWIELDTANKIQLNYVAIGENTYMIAIDTTDTQTCKITRMMYYENKTLKKNFNVTSNNEFALISKESYLVTSVGNDSRDFTYVKEPLYDNKSKTVYQIMKHIKYDKRNGNLILNFVSNETDSSASASASASPSPSPSATPTPVVATPTPTATTGTSGFRNIEGFSKNSETTDAIQVYKRKMESTEFVNPTKIYTTETQKSLSSSLDDTASKPYFVSDTFGNNTVIYWPNGETTLVTIFANCSVNEMVPFGFVYFSPDEVEENTKPPKKKEDDKEKEEKNIENAMDDYTKWSQYMLKTEVVPPVCPACPSCNSGGGGLCMDCGGKGGCGTRSSDGKSLTTTDNDIADVKGPSSAVASLGKSAGGAITGTVDAAGNVVTKTVDSAGNLVGGTIGTAANLVSGTIGTAADLLKSTGSGLNSLVSSDVRRVGYNQSYRGPAAGTNANNGYNRNNTGIGMVDSVPIDVYSYNGALQSKGSDFRPLTANFSTFSK